MKTFLHRFSFEFTYDNSVLKHRSAPCQTKLRLASKARLARWMKPKGCRKDLVAPEWIRKEWDSSDRNALAEMFVNANFDKVPLLMSCQFS